MIPRFFQWKICLWSLCFFSAGCASVVSKILPPEFTPVTKDRCEKLDMKSIGLEDGKGAKRKGDRFDFWKKDCTSFGVSLDQNLYSQGYDEGLGFYCSCEEGFLSGAKAEFEELRGQFQSCSKSQYKEFMRGRSLGAKAYEKLSPKDRELEIKKTGDLEVRNLGTQQCKDGSGEGSKQ